MAGPAETKICPLCAETIKAAAKKCPFCNSALPSSGFRRQEIVTGISYLILIGGFIFAVAVLAPKDSMEDGRDFARHRQELEVVKLNVDLVNSGTTALSYNASGFVTNKGDHPWRVREFELTVSNIVGVADIRNDRLSEPFVVQPHAEHAFAFRCNTIVTNQIVGARVRVAAAQDGRKSPEEHF